MAESPKIPKLELEKFFFSPPGPMGWNMAEYEKMIGNNMQLVLNESTVNFQLQSLQNHELEELTLSGDWKAHTSSSINKNVDSLLQEESITDAADKDVEVVVEEEILEVPIQKRKVTIIVEETALKLPWVAQKSSTSPKNRRSKHN